MRKYARYGEPQLRHRVLSAPMSIAVNAERQRYRDGHILTLDWPSKEEASLRSFACTTGSPTRTRCTSPILSTQSGAISEARSTLTSAPDR